MKSIVQFFAGSEFQVDVVESGDDRRDEARALVKSGAIYDYLRGDREAHEAVVSFAADCGLTQSAGMDALVSEICEVAGEAA